ELDNGAHETIVRGGLPKCHISFTFDDGPHSKLTRQLLNLLAGEEVKVNFFTLGERVRGATDIVLRAAREGHIVGNHTYSHKNLPTLRQSDAEAEIVRGFQELEKVFGGFIPFFRFPYGA